MAQRRDRWGFTVAVLLLGATLVAAAPQETAPPTSTNGAEEAPDNSPAVDLSEVNSLVKDQKYADAERLAGDLLEAHPDDPGLLALRGELLLALGKPDEAIAPLRRAAELAPDRPRVHFQLATALAATGDSDGALEAFSDEVTISEDPQVLVLARLNRSLLLQRQKRWADAASELEAALAIDPSRAPVYGDLATLYLELDRVDDSISALSRGADAGFRSARHWFTVGARLVKDERYESSIEPLERALEVDPQLADAERTLGVALDHLGKTTEAVDHFRRYLELAPNAPDAKTVKERIAQIQNS